MRPKSLASEQMEAHVARFHKLQTYQTQNFQAHNIPPGALEKVAARRVSGDGAGGFNLFLRWRARVRGRAAKTRPWAAWLCCPY